MTEPNLQSFKVYQASPYYEYVIIPDKRKGYHPIEIQKLATIEKSDRIIPEIDWASRLEKVKEIL